MSPTPTAQVPLWQLVNMNVGWIGIQFGWGLQFAYASALFETLGAKPEDIALLWLPAPVSGLLAQPIAGHLSDRIWTPWGRRRPLFIASAIVGGIALLLLPRAPNLRTAAVLVWVLDAAANTASVAFRALIGDMLPAEQQTQGFAVQSVLICIGALSAAAFAWACEALHGSQKGADWSRGHGVPGPIAAAFNAGAVVYIVSAVWSVVHTPERPPAEKTHSQHVSLLQVMRAPLYGVRNMPPTMRQLAPVHCLGHAGLYAFYLYLAPGVARKHFGATDEKDPRYTQGVEFAGLMISFYNMCAAPCAIMLPRIARRLTRPVTHACCLGVGGLSLLLVRLMPRKELLFACMIGTGVAWASILTLPFAILLGCVPRESVGMYCGVNNLFVVFPETVGSFAAGWVLDNLLGGDELKAVAVGGAFMMMGGVLALRIDDAAGRESAGSHAAAGVGGALPPRGSSLSPAAKAKAHRLLDGHV
eukprot:TRINITY_DN65463_c0_g1_i1.p1 TRINITY_DN65463_c0_g1~~TRINITY_DN65463_c0_g1_i1.p1  ORF type:complete len:474 (+),score=115.48 TRINITY_DN65463_c0_g1_i1:89-1510(+)